MAELTREPISSIPEPVFLTPESAAFSLSTSTLCTLGDSLTGAFWEVELPYLRGHNAAFGELFGKLQNQDYRGVLSPLLTIPSWPPLSSTEGGPPGRTLPSG